MSSLRATESIFNDIHCNEYGPIEHDRQLYSSLYPYIERFKKNNNFSRSGIFYIIQY